MNKTVIAIDPVTRLEGHLKVEVQVEDGKVADAWITGGMFRGFEAILRGRNPRDASQIVQRICGVCPVSHAHASSIAGDKATASPFRTTPASCATCWRALSSCTAISCGCTTWRLSIT